MRSGKMVSMVVDKKVWRVSYKMALGTINLAKEKYQGQNAIVAVEKDDTVVLQKDVYDSTNELIKAIEGWTKGGYKCYYVSKGE